MEPYKGTRKSYTYDTGKTVDVVELPDGSYRIGLTKASLALGFSKEWLGRLLKSKGTSFKALQGMGFTGLQEQVRLDQIEGGGTISQTISFEDWQVLKIYAVTKNKPEAIALMVEGSVKSDLDAFNELFGKTSTKKEKKEVTLSVLAAIENAHQRNREDVAVIEAQEKFLGLEEYRR